MKTVVRSGMFETNSSSAHTLVYTDKKKIRLLPPLDFQYLVDNDDNLIHIKLYTYGREIDCLKSLDEKLSYIATGIVGWCDNNIETERYSFRSPTEDDVPPKEWRAWLSDKEKIENDPEWQMVERVVKKYLEPCGCNGIIIEPSSGMIDHQSEGFYKKIIDGKNTTLEQVLFSDTVYILVDHDEH